MTTVIVTVHSAKELHLEDFFKNDPYVEAWFDKDYKQRTSTVENSNFPTWEEDLTLLIPEGSSDYKLRLRVMDEDTFTSDDQIGKGKLDISPLLDGEVDVMEEEVDLPAKLGLSSHGTIQVTVRLGE
ncbi:unnamed protein product [Cunninghamella blakesleeana]